MVGTKWFATQTNVISLVDPIDSLMKGLVEIDSPNPFSDVNMKSKIDLSYIIA